MGVAFLDISTGEFLTAEGTPDYVDKLLVNFSPKEVLVENDKKRKFEQLLAGNRCLVSGLDDWIFTIEAATERLLRQFETGSLKGFGINNMPAAIIAAGAILHYLDITQHTNISHISSLSRIEEDKYVRLDRFTVRNLELTESMGEDGKCLLDVIDRTVSPMGARMLRRWMLFPLKDPAEINKRLDVVEYFFRKPDEREELKLVGADWRHGEAHIQGRRRQGVAPRAAVQLRNALSAIAPIKELCVNADQPGVQETGNKLNLCSEPLKAITDTIVDDAPSALGKGR